MAEDQMPDAVREEIEAGMRTAGQPLEESGQVDYFGLDQIETVHLPDGKSVIEFRVLNEGDKRKYQNTTNRDVVIQRSTGDARMRMQPGDERHLLLEMSIVGWNLVQRNPQTGRTDPVPFSDRNLKKWLQVAPPRIVEIVEKEIRKANPWLLQDMSVEDIEKEIANLEEMLETKKLEEAGKSSSGNE